MMRCCICDDIIRDPDSHNAQPVASGRCCDYCNDIVVIPARLKQLPLFVSTGSCTIVDPAPETLARSSDRKTSHMAARSINPTIGMWRVLSLFKEQRPDGKTGEWTDRDGNIAYAETHGGAEGTFRKRRNDLVTQGFVIDSGRCEDGRKHTVWILTDKGQRSNVSEDRAL
jgi:hypothetical protein